MRASDAERQFVADRLARHHLEGRLDVEEYEERLDRCYAAKTVGELEEISADLPRGEVAPAPDGRRRPSRRAAVLPILVALVALSALTGAHVFVLAVPLMFFALGGVGRCGRWRGPAMRPPADGTA